MLDLREQLAGLVLKVSQLRHVESFCEVGLKSNGCGYLREVLPQYIQNAQVESGKSGRSVFTDFLVQPTHHRLHKELVFGLMLRLSEQIHQYAHPVRLVHPSNGQFIQQLGTSLWDDTQYVIQKLMQRKRHFNSQLIHVHHEVLRQGLQLNRLHYFID